MAWVETTQTPTEGSEHYRDDYGNLSWVQYYDDGVDIDVGDTFYLVWSIGGGGETEWSSSWYNHDATKIFRSVYMPSMSAGVYSWHFKFKKPGEEEWSYSTAHSFTLNEGNTPLPKNPTPADTATEIDFSGLTLSWEDGGAADTYNVYVGDAVDNLTLISSAQSSVSIVLSDVQRALFTDTCYWRIDPINENGTRTGNDWWFTVAAPGKAQNPTPTDDQEDIKITGIEKLKKLQWEAPA